MNDLLKEKNYVIFDDIIDRHSVFNLEDDFLKLPWNFAGNLVSLSNSTLEKYKNNKNVKDYLKLVHDFYDVSGWKGEFSEISDFILDRFLQHIDEKVIHLLRSKANLQTQYTNNNSKLYNTPHIDFVDAPHYVLIYYVNDSDGDTILFNEDEEIIVRVSPKAGRYVLFDGNILHSGSNPVNSKYRMIVNFNLGKV